MQHWYRNRDHERHDYSLSLLLETLSAPTTETSSEDSQRTALNCVLHTTHHSRDKSFYILMVIKSYSVFSFALRHELCKKLFSIYLRLYACLWRRSGSGAGNGVSNHHQRWHSGESNSETHLSVWVVDRSVYRCQQSLKTCCSALALALSLASHKSHYC